MLQRASGTVLEVAMGTGKNLPYYPRGCRIIGADASKEMLAVAQRRASRFQLDICFFLANAEALPFPDETFDTVVSSLSMCTFPDPVATLREMARLAREARERAQAPYSRFKVGAALKTRAGEIVTGCNIENASYGLTMCAERVAVFKAVSEGLNDFDAIAVVADSKRLTPPCGPCRQLLWEYCGDIVVHMLDLKGRSRTLRLAKLLPMPFDAGHL